MPLISTNNVVGINVLRIESVRCYYFLKWCSGSGEAKLMKIFPYGIVITFRANTSICLVDKQYAIVCKISDSSSAPYSANPARNSPQLLGRKYPKKQRSPEEQPHSHPNDDRVTSNFTSFAFLKPGSRLRQGAL